MKRHASAISTQHLRSKLRERESEEKFKNVIDEPAWKNVEPNRPAQLLVWVIILDFGRGFRLRFFVCRLWPSSFCCPERSADHNWHEPIDRYGATVSASIAQGRAPLMRSLFLTLPSAVSIFIHTHWWNYCFFITFRGRDFFFDRYFFYNRLW